MSQIINIHKAQGISGKEIPAVQINIETETPDFETLEQVDRVYEIDALKIGKTLLDCLPEGTIDRPLAHLLLQKASHFKIPFEYKENP